MDVKPLLLTLAFAVTVGSAATPMGNPQNLLIAVASGLDAPVLQFAYYLLDPGPHRPRADRPGAQIPLQEGDWHPPGPRCGWRPENRRAFGETDLLPGRRRPW